MACSGTMDNANPYTYYSSSEGIPCLEGDKVDG